MSQALTLFFVAFTSALFPLVNVEAYLGVTASVVDDVGVWGLALVAATGQMCGKLIWFFLGWRSLGWGWIRRKLEKPKQRERLARWQARTEARPVYAGALTFVSAFTGLPPFAILSVVAGQLRMNVALFVTLGMVGRWLRFVVILGGVSWMNQTWFA